MGKSIVPGRAQQLQFLRFVAFLMIFFWHAQAWLPAWDLRQNTATSMVSFFFVLSGVVKGFSSLEKEQTLTLKSYCRNYLKRLFKVYPLYAVTMLAMVYVSKFPVYLAEENFGALKSMLTQLGKNMLLIQSWFDTQYFSFNGVGWFLSTLMFLFLFTDPAVYVFKTIYSKKRGILFLGLLLLGIFVAGVTYNYSVHTLNQQFWAYVFPPARLCEYLGGIIVGMLAKKASQREKNTALFTILEALVLVLWGAVLFIPLDTFGTRIANWLIPNFLGLFIFAIGGGYFSKIFSAKPLVALGDISFECFLIHQVVLMGYTAAVPVASYTALTKLFSLAFCLCGTLVLSFAANRVLQKKQVGK